MTTTLPPQTQNPDETGATRRLPTMSDTEGWTAAVVAEIAGVDPLDLERAERGSETTWRETAERRPDWGWPT